MKKKEARGRLNELVKSRFSPHTRNRYFLINALELLAIPETIFLISSRTLFQNTIIAGEIETGYSGHRAKIF